MNTFALLRGRDATAEGQASAGGPARNSAEAPKFAYIDCLRGYAVLMVMITHTTYAFAGLPYPVHKLGAYGWHGVQLFFLGMIGEYVLAIYGQVRNKPVLFERERVNFPPT